MRSRQRLAMLFHLVGAEQFCPQRRCIIDVLRQGTAAQTCPPTGQSVAHACPAQLHFKIQSLP
jgi:hypothetical protein